MGVIIGKAWVFGDEINTDVMAAGLHTPCAGHRCNESGTIGPGFSVWV